MAIRPCCTNISQFIRRGGKEFFPEITDLLGTDSQSEDVGRQGSPPASLSSSKLGAAIPEGRSAQHDTSITLHEQQGENQTSALIALSMRVCES